MRAILHRAKIVVVVYFFILVIVLNEPIHLTPYLAVNILLVISAMV